MSRIYTKDLTRRISNLEDAAIQSAPGKRNPLLDISTRAMACAWTPDEIEEILVAAESGELGDLPADLCRRWAHHLDRLAMANLGKTFAALLPASDVERLPTLSAPAPGEQHKPGDRVTSVRPNKPSKTTVR